MKKRRLISFFKKVSLFIGLLFCTSYVLNAQITFASATCGIASTTLQPAGDDGNNRNIFEFDDGNIVRAEWDSGQNRWEINLYSGDGMGGFTFCCTYVYNTSASVPNPPSLNLGTWQSDFFGMDCTASGFVLTGDVQSDLTTGCNDTEDPVITCPADITVDNDPGQCGAVVNIPNPNVSDDCPGVSFEYAPASGTAFDVGTTTVTATATDASDNTVTCTLNVTVNDTEAPTLVCQDLTVYLDQTGSVNFNPLSNGGIITRTDNCVFDRTAGVSNAPSGCVSTFTQNISQSDASGNFDQCTVVYTILDTLAPMAVCQDITVNLNTSGLYNLDPNELDGGSTDNCGVAGFGINTTVFDCDDVGETFPIELIVSDNTGNFALCTANVTVRDGDAPTVTCVASPIVLTDRNNDPGACSYTAQGTEFDATATDNCGVASLTNNFNNAGTLAGAAFPVGTTQLRWTALDATGNLDTCSIKIRVLDNTPPTALCQNLTVQLNATGNASILGSDINGGSTANNCSSQPVPGGIASLSATATAFTCSDVGENNISTLTVTDVNGNFSTCDATITVEDNVAPTALCQNLTVQLDANGNGSATAAAVNNGSGDACGILSLSLSQTSFDCSEVGPNTETLTVTDVNGNTSTCTATVTVEDNNPPTAVCADPTVNLISDTLITSVAASFFDGGSFAICGPVDFSASMTDFDCDDVGNTYNVTLTVTSQSSGLSDVCTASVTVADPNSFCCAPPMAVCENITVQLDAGGNASITPAGIGSSSTAECGLASESLDIMGFDCADVGGNTVTYTITDVNNESGQCAATVTVEDNVAPTALCQNLTVQLDADGNGSITAQDIDSGSSDACGIQSLSLSQTDFGCAQVGANTVTLTVTDVNGIVNTCTATATVEDNVAPTALCQNLTVQLDADGNGSITAQDVDSGSCDACGIQSLSLSQTDFDCSEVGANNVTLTVTDNNGNPSTCAATVTVEDNITPTAVCLNTTVEIQSDGMYDLQQSDVYDPANSNDNCSLSSVSFLPATFTCDDADQAFNITVTVKDPSGNTNNCTATVSVEAGSSLPAEWTTSDIGDPGNGSDYTYDPCVGNNPGQGDFTISTGGYNLIPQNSDNLAFATVPLCGNGGIQARIESVSGGYGGLMIRESSAPGAKMVAVYSNLTNLLRRETRTVTNGPRTSGTLFAAFPKWLRLVRQGDYIRAFYRNSNGGNWTLFHQAYVPMGNCVEMGLAVFTTDPNGDASAVFSSVNYQSQGVQNLSAPNGLVWEAETPEEVKASVVPNPVRGQFILQFSKPLPTAGQATLLNEFGQRLSQQPLSAGETELGWDTGALPAGLYFLEVVTGDGYREVLKVVRQ
ncbi:HYR domain-containing protein [Phaeodactylibacter xiamenensis]|uniref:T9SS type A sorting domain-containing protein n=1 Tax=Phaeodactylibacter xiamenensis TaxID=1524460 RepID=UPI003BAA1902